MKFVVLYIAWAGDYLFISTVISLQSYLPMLGFNLTLFVICTYQGWNRFIFLQWEALQSWREVIICDFDLIFILILPHYWSIL